MAQGRITHIPVPGSSGQTPTGAMQFEQDWPGLFVRGDDAICLMTAIRHVEQLLGKRRLPHELAEIAEIIERDVRISGDAASAQPE